MRELILSVQHACAAAAVVLALSGIQTSRALAQVTPPQGYIAVDRSFAGPLPSYHDGTQTGFYNLDSTIELLTLSEDQSGTFWANSLRFMGSETSPQYPVNYVGGRQGGYLGLQINTPTRHTAMFSLWWALDAEPGPNAECLHGMEMWYLDDRPFEPPIAELSDVDTTRRTAGGPFYSCRLGVTIEADKRYTLRVWEVSDAEQPNEPEWWGAWLINETDGTEEYIGKIQVPGNWGWLSGDTGGFIEHFGPMPAGCDSIPASEARIYATRADGGLFTSSLALRTYGACQAAIDPRTYLHCEQDQCTAEID
jgi:hypothetical protein